MLVNSDVSNLILHGLAAAPGRAYGKPYLLLNSQAQIVKPNAVHALSVDIEGDPNDSQANRSSQKVGSSSDIESQKLSIAYSKLAERLQQLVKKAEKLGRTEEADILLFHTTVLADESLQMESESLIIEYGLSAADAVSQVYIDQIKRFEQIKDDRISSKALDLYDILNSILMLLHADEEALITSLPENSIIIADDISPSQLIALPSENIAGIVCEHGDTESHTAVLAAGLQIPAVFGCSGIIEVCDTPESPNNILVDGTSGQVMIEPDKCQIETTFANDVLNLQPAITADGVRLELLANIVSIEEYNRSNDIYYDGTGLLRTETLFAGSSIAPDEELQYIRYRQAVSLASHQEGPIIIRSFDLAESDSVRKGRLSIVSERNFSPGERGLARSLRQPDELRTQLRAIIRACAGRECSVLFPLVMSCADFVRAAKLAQEAYHELGREEKKLPYSLKIGAMIETPEAVAEADKLFDLADFISIGSNDLASYSDGGLFNDENMNMIKHLTSRPEALSGQKRVILCGELAASPSALPIWLRLGLRSFSINIQRMREFKKTVAVLQVHRTIM
ncbi:MAG: phosphoenolpyruvate--protein phosphotransferase [Clostridiaceae bacterium]|nr:phosphoenolpyruvate--protein phosphotransferase [Clostridiaceae bacterium]